MPSLRESFRQKADQLNFELDKRNRIGQVQRQIDALKKQNATDVIQIGTKVVDLHRHGQMPIDDLTALCQGIVDHEKEIAVLQAKIAAIQQEAMPQPASPPMMPQQQTPASVPCPTCQTQVMIGARFCPNCGQPMDVAPVALPGPLCPGCGAPTVTGAAFCVECGYSLPAPTPPLPPMPAMPPMPSLPPIAPLPPMPPVMPVLPLPSMPESIAAAQSSGLEPVIASSSNPSSIQQLDAYAPASETELPICPTCGAVQRRMDVHFCFVCGNTMSTPPSSQEPAQ